MKNLTLVFLLFLPFLTFAKPAPDFTVTDSDGKQHKLYADYLNKQKVVVFEMFFTTCPPCATHAPHFQTAYTTAKTQHPGQVEFFILSVLQSDLNTKVATYRTQKGLTMPGVGSDGGSTAALAPYQNGQFGQYSGTPTFVIVAPGTGEVFFNVEGNTPQETMALIQQKINQLLAPAPPVTCFLGDSTHRLPNVSLRVISANFDTTFVADGSYSLSNFSKLKNQTYSITPSKTDNPLNGVSTFDLLLISKHILAVDTLDTPFQKLSADVNLSGTITTFDIVSIRKVILGIEPHFPVGKSWGFVPPVATAANGGCASFDVFKYGDVNGNANANNRPSESGLKKE